jgi:hypothetical protein
VIGQISVATTAGIQKNLHSNIGHLQHGNATMRDIIEKAAPSVVMEKVVAHQRDTLANTNRTMIRLNATMDSLGGTTSDLKTTVGTMQTASGNLATGIEGMNSDTARIVKLLKPLPAATERTHRQLSRIANDSGDINTELGQISNKMVKYGLPHAQNVKGHHGRAVV